MSPFAGKTLLVTGGTGSFGQALMRRLSGSGVSEVRLFSRHAAEHEALSHALPQGRVKLLTGDVCDPSAVDAAMQGVHVVFAAAAMKEVPACELAPADAVRVNVLGTENVIRSAVAHHVERVVVLSTDMAVRPLNAMGMTKALMEKVVAVESRKLDGLGRTVLCCTRHGNLVGSCGSVVPLWMQQLRMGNALTITDPDMTRFMMTMDDAVNLVLFALQHAANGDLFVPRAPSATLQTLAEATLMVWTQRAPNEGLSLPAMPSPALRVMGKRPGEKLFETMATAEEMARAEDLEGYYRIPRDTPAHLSRLSRGSDAHEYNSHITTRLTLDEMTSIVASAVQ
jgi:UDP-N-acetylglucosamine 4,6-dehydratase